MNVVQEVLLVGLKKEINYCISLYIRKRTRKLAHLATQTPFGLYSKLDFGGAKKWRISFFKIRWWCHNTNHFPINSAIIAQTNYRHLLSFEIQEEMQEAFVIQIFFFFQIKGLMSMRIFTKIT